MCDATTRPLYSRIFAFTPSSTLLCQEDASCVLKIALTIRCIHRQLDTRFLVSTLPLPYTQSHAYFEHRLYTDSIPCALDTQHLSVVLPLNYLRLMHSLAVAAAIPTQLRARRRMHLTTGGYSRLREVQIRCPSWRMFLGTVPAPCVSRSHKPSSSNFFAPSHSSALGTHGHARIVVR